MPTASTSTSTSPSPASGAGTSWASRTSGPPFCSNTIARILRRKLPEGPRRLEGCGARSTIRCRCGGCLCCDAEIGEQGLHVAAEGFVVAVDGGPVLGWAALSWCADSGGEGRDDLVAEGE